MAVMSRKRLYSPQIDRILEWMRRDSSQPVAAASVVDRIVHTFDLVKRIKPRPLIASSAMERKDERHLMLRSVVGRYKQQRIPFTRQIKTVQSGRNRTDRLFQSGAQAANLGRWSSVRLTSESCHGRTAFPSQHSKIGRAHV